MTEGAARDEVDWIDGQFRANRSRLEGIAYRMLGSHASAEDAVQETWLRVMRSDPASIDNVAGWLTTVTGRICLDRLKSSSSRLEDTDDKEVFELKDASPENDPAHSALIADSVGAALTVVLESMTPEERVAFVLHDVFAVPFEPIGEILDRSPQAARKLASRARQRIQGTAVESRVDAEQHRTLVEAFLQAAREGDLEGLVLLLHPDVMLLPDAAAQAMGSRPETRGAREVATILSGGARGTHLVLADGLAALAWGSKTQIRSIIEFTIVDGRISRINVTADREQIVESDVTFLQKASVLPPGRREDPI